MSKFLLDLPDDLESEVLSVGSRMGQTTRTGCIKTILATYLDQRKRKFSVGFLVEILGSLDSAERGEILFELTKAHLNDLKLESNDE